MMSNRVDNRKTSTPQGWITPLSNYEVSARLKRDPDPNELVGTAGIQFELRPKTSSIGAPGMKDRTYYFEGLSVQETSEWLNNLHLLLMVSDDNDRRNHDSHDDDRMAEQ